MDCLSGLGTSQCILAIEECPIIGVTGSISMFISAQFEIATISTVPKLTVMSETGFNRQHLVQLTDMDGDDSDEDR